VSFKEEKEKINLPPTPLWDSVILSPKHVEQATLSLVLPKFSESQLLYRWTRDEHSNKRMHQQVDN
jgi:hypothetical protein